MTVDIANDANVSASSELLSMLDTVFADSTLKTSAATIISQACGVELLTVLAAIQSFQSGRG